MDNRFKKVITAYERLNSVVQGGIIHILRDDVPKKENAPGTNRYTQTRQKSTLGFSYTGNVRNSKYTQMTRRAPQNGFIAAMYQNANY